MPPAVAEAAQVWGPAAPVGPQRCGHLADAQTHQATLHHHLAGELHARRAQVQAEDRVAAERAQTAVEVAHRGAEEQSADERQHRVADVAVQPRHRPGLDAAGETVAHHQIVAGAQPVEERPEGGEVVAVVGIAHRHIGAARRGDPADQRRAVAPLGHRHHPGALGLGERLRAVGAAVVGHQHLAGDPGRFEELACLAHTRRHRLGLVQAGHHDRQFAGRVGRGGGCCRGCCHRRCRPIRNPDAQANWMVG
jgi:hypothetical protein